MPPSPMNINKNIFQKTFTNNFIHSKMQKYKYEYYSNFESLTNKNMKIICKIFNSKYEYEYHL